MQGNVIFEISNPIKKDLTAKRAPSTELQRSYVKLIGSAEQTLHCRENTNLKNAFHKILFIRMLSLDTYLVFGIQCLHGNPSSAREHRFSVMHN